MDDIVKLFTTTDGRISRKSWWLGTVIIIVVNIVISFLVLPIFGTSMMPDVSAIMSGTADPAALSQLAADAVQRSAWVSLILFVVFAYPIYALGLKRRHDRDNNGMDLIVYLGLTALVLLIQALGFGMGTTTIGGMTIPTPEMWLTLLNFAIGVYAVYLLVVLGFLRGTAGANQYGPDPLGGAQPAAA